jgi:hypothetical protein
MNESFMTFMAEAEDRPKLAPEFEAVRLRDALAALNVAHKFVPGMIVQQKGVARIYSDYGDNDLAIVVRVLDEPVIHPNNDPSSSSFRSVVDMVIGSIEPSRRSGMTNFVIWHVDSRRFEPAPDEVLTYLK